MNIFRWCILLTLVSCSISSYFISSVVDRYIQRSSKNIYDTRASNSASNIINSIYNLETLSSITVSLEAVDKISVPFFNAVCAEYFIRDTSISRSVYIERIPIHLQDEVEKYLTDTYNETVSISPIGPSLIPGEDLWVVFNIFPFVYPIVGLELFSDPIRRDLIERLLISETPQTTYNIPLVDTGESGLISMQPVSKGGVISGATVSVFRYEIFFTRLFAEFSERYPEPTECVYIKDDLVYSTGICPVSPILDDSFIHVVSLDAHVSVSKYRYSMTSVFPVTMSCLLLIIVVVLGILLQFEKRREKAISQSEFKSRFLSDISHEIRTPMNGIIGSYELLVDKITGIESLAHLETIRTCGFSLLELINDVLDISSIESGNMIIRLSDVNFIECIQDCIRKCWITYKKTNGINNNSVELNLIIGGNFPLSIICDERRITQVINNLVKNALAFTSQGSVLVHIDVSNLTEDRCSISISVADTGVGMDPSHIKHVMTPFTRGHDHLDAGGSGLGLSISNGLCLLMGGNLECRSELGNGSKFFFKLDVRVRVSSPNTDSIFNTYNQEYMGENPIQMNPMDSMVRILESIIPTVLVVDDIKVNRLVLSKILSNMGIIVDTCVDGQEAIDMCKNKKYSLIFMDMVMPKVNGIDATISIRKSGLNQDVCIVFVSADISSSSYDKCIDSGGTDHITKPVTKTVLMGKLCKYLLPQEVECVRRSLEIEEV